MVDLACRRLAVSLVVHHWCEKELYPAVETLGKSLMAAREQGLLDEAALFVIYNGELPSDPQSRFEALARFFRFRSRCCRLRRTVVMARRTTCFLSILHHNRLTRRWS